LDHWLVIGLIFDEESYPGTIVFLPPKLIGVSPADSRGEPWKTNAEIYSAPLATSQAAMENESFNKYSK